MKPSSHPRRSKINPPPPLPPPHQKLKHPDRKQPRGCQERPTHSQGRVEAGPVAQLTPLPWEGGGRAVPAPSGWALRRPRWAGSPAGRVSDGAGPRPSGRESGWSARLARQQGQSRPGNPRNPAQRAERLGGGGGARYGSRRRPRGLLGPHDLHAGLVRGELRGDLVHRRVL